MCCPAWVAILVNRPTNLYASHLVESTPLAGQEPLATPLKHLLGVFDLQIWEGPINRVREDGGNMELLFIEKTRLGSSRFLKK